MSPTWHSTKIDNQERELTTKDESVAKKEKVTAQETKLNLIRRFENVNIKGRIE